MPFSVLIIKKPGFWLKAVFLLAVAGWFLWYAFKLPDSFFLDNVNLLIHEAGHWVFWWFGEFIRVAGGTLLQLLIPLAFVLYFYFKKHYFSSAIVLLWLAQNLVNISVYLADARRQVLPLLGGDRGIHDWNYLLGRLGLLNQAELLGGLVRTAGIILMLLAVALGIFFLFKQEREKLEY